MSRDELRRLALIYRFYDEIISGRIIIKAIPEKRAGRRMEMEQTDAVIEGWDFIGREGWDV